LPLTDVALRSAKPTDSIQKLSDGGGLQLWIMPNGSKLWRLAYRFDGKQKKRSIGRYPSVGLSEARAKREEAKSLLAMRRDPSIQKQTDKALAIEVQGQTFQKIASEVLAKKHNEGKASNAPGKLEPRHRLANAALGNRPISEKTAPEVLSALRKVEGKGRLETAKRLRATIGKVFRFAIATARATNDSTFALRGALTAPTVKHRAAITEPKGLGALLRAIEAFEGQPTTVAALKLMAILFPRPGELRLAEWRKFDLANALWTIPASRAKMRREHRVPLPRQALAVLEGLKPYTGHGALVLPGLRTVMRPISENTMNAALRRTGYSQDDMTSHGLHVAASSLLNESGRSNPDAIERALTGLGAPTGRCRSAGLCTRRTLARASHHGAMVGRPSGCVAGWREGHSAESRVNHFDSL
jgi:integrase